MNYFWIDMNVRTIGLFIAFEWLIKSQLFVHLDLKIWIYFEQAKEDGSAPSLIIWGASWNSGFNMDYESSYSCYLDDLQFDWTYHLPDVSGALTIDFILRFKFRWRPISLHCRLMGAYWQITVEAYKAHYEAYWNQYWTDLRLSSKTGARWATRGASEGCKWHEGPSLEDSGAYFALNWSFMS